MRKSQKDRLANLERNFEALCYCQIATACHNADCLSTILKFQDLPCPAHGFRFLGTFSRVPPTDAVLPNDREFCYCLPNTDLENYSWESPFERWERDFLLQMRLMGR